jgi:Rha family phage regulatory protein
MRELVTIQDGQPVTNSLLVAEVFGKEHNKVCRDIERLSCSKTFRVANFGDTPYINPQNGQTYKMYVMTKDGFTFLVMGYTGEKAGEFKEKYIAAFNEMDNTLRNGIALRVAAVEENIKRRYLLAKEMQDVNAQITVLMKRHEAIKKEMHAIDAEDFRQLSLFPKYEVYAIKNAFPNKVKMLK